MAGYWYTGYWHTGYWHTRLLAHRPLGHRDGGRELRGESCCIIDEYRTHEKRNITSLYKDCNTLRMHQQVLYMPGLLLVFDASITTCLLLARQLYPWKDAGSILTLISLANVFALNWWVKSAHPCQDEFHSWTRTNKQTQTLLPLFISYQRSFTCEWSEIIHMWMISPSHTLLGALLEQDHTQQATATCAHSPAILYMADLTLSVLGVLHWLY